ncbi:MAG: peptide chain release factor N(5)-glutamine methyltransferase [Actinomycetota bacterium]
MEGRWILERARARNRKEPLQESEVEASALEMAERRASGEPLQYVLGTASFRHLELAVGPGVLIPRPETEVLVETALARTPRDGTVVDVGTGSGAIALSIKNERPDVRVWATDDSADALHWAAANRQALGLEVEIVNGELFEGLPPDLLESVDVVVSNPPYVALSERDLVGADVIAHEPHHALFAGTDGLAVLERLANDSVRWLRQGGWLVCEVGHEQDERATALLEREDYVDVGAHSDLTGRPRIIEGRKRGPSG